jgi:hypothetical protein
MSLILHDSFSNGLIFPLPAVVNTPAADVQMILNLATPSPAVIATTTSSHFVTNGFIVALSNALINVRAIGPTLFSGALVSADPASTPISVPTVNIFNGRILTPSVCSIPLVSAIISLVNIATPDPVRIQVNAERNFYRDFASLDGKFVSHVSYQAELESGGTVLVVPITSLQASIKTPGLDANGDLDPDVIINDELTINVPITSASQLSDITTRLAVTPCLITVKKRTHYSDGTSIVGAVWSTWKRATHNTTSRNRGVGSHTMSLRGLAPAALEKRSTLHDVSAGYTESVNTDSFSVSFPFTETIFPADRADTGSSVFTISTIQVSISDTTATMTLSSE